MIEFKSLTKGQQVIANILVKEAADKNELPSTSSKKWMDDFFYGLAYDAIEASQIYFDKVLTKKEKELTMSIYNIVRRGNF